MRRYLITPVLLSIAAYAQDEPKPPQNTRPEQPQAQRTAPMLRRLESVTWNPMTAELSWVVSNWNSLETDDPPASQETYSMSVDSATMKFNGKGRQFDPVEAQHLRALMDFISLYAVESTVWWDQGKGEADREVDRNEQKKKDSEDPTKVGPKAAPTVLRGPVGLGRASGRAAGLFAGCIGR